MRRSLGGFTIIEVMIFLGISAVIFAGAVATFDGQNGRTQFEQGMRDLSSKLQQYIDQVSTGSSPGNGQYTCIGEPVNQRPVLSQPAGAGHGCIFLGQAVAATSQTQLSSYEILGNQYQADGITPVSDISQANPTVASDSSGLVYALIDRYDTSWGSLAAAKINGASTKSYLVGFLNDLSGGQSLIACSYGVTDTTDDNSAALAIRNPINASCSQKVTDWTLCYNSTVSSQQAELTLRITPTGANADVNFSPPAADCS